MLDFMWDKCSVMEKYRAEEVNVFIDFMLGYCCPIAIIFLLFLSLNYHLQMGRCNCGIIGGQ